MRVSPPLRHPGRPRARSNCVRTLPHVVALHARYVDRGLVVLGIHTPEFAFERSTENVRAALARFGITYPVAQDNGYATWKAWNNHSWPAQYLVDQQGTILLKHVGEGQYDEMEDAIRTLLAIPDERRAGAAALRTASGAPR